MSAIAAGSVNTTWKYGAGRRSAWRSASHSFAAAPWHFGQCRLRQLLYAIVVCEAVLAARAIAAERRRAATLDRRHDLQLAEAHMAGVGHAPSGPVVTEDVRELHGGTGHERWRARRAARLASAGAA